MDFIHFGKVCTALTVVVIVKYYIAPFIIAQVKELSTIINDARNTL